MKRVLAVVVTYYPDELLLKENISSFIDNVDKVLIWENTASSDKMKYRFISHKKVDYCGDGVNSISRALNYAWRYAKKNNYDFLLTMDQDSVWENFDVYLSKTCNNPVVPLGFYGPCINSDSDQKTFFQTELITSGMLLPVYLLEQIGGYNEVFKVDGIDTWLCYLANERGINTYCVPGCVLKQRFGNLHKVHLGCFSFVTLDYPAWRLYEMYKSYVIILRRFNVSGRLKRQFYCEMLGKYLFKILIAENSVIPKFKAILLGIRDGLCVNLKLIG